MLAGVLGDAEARMTVRVAAAETLPALFEVRHAGVEPALVRAAEAALKKFAAP